MWLFLNNAFFSIVQHENYDNVMVVRARIAGDIQKVFGTEYEVFEDAGTDYKFRTFVTRTEVKKAMEKEIDKITYSNFKDSISKKDKARSNAYSNVWGCMMDYQDRVHPPKYPTDEYAGWWRDTLHGGYKYRNSVVNDDYEGEYLEDSVYYREIEEKWELATKVP